jgi:pimeloyl-ACP methyl ester carboxylesterase/DNA-binding CsgD family transcriptional regulator
VTELAQSVRIDLADAIARHAVSGAAIIAATMKAPRIEYAKTSDGVGIAYFSLGDGPPIVFASNIFGDVHHYNLPYPPTRRMTDELVERGWRVIMHDLRGMGSSDRNVEDMSLAARALDVEAIVSRLQLRRFALAGLDGGAVVAIEYAARHAAQVSQLILLNPFASGRRRFERVPAVHALASLSPMMEHDWAYTMLLAGNVVTGLLDPNQAREMAAGFQRSTSAKTWIAHFEALKETDLTPLLPLLSIPTLVVHDIGFPFGSLEMCQEVASGIAHARLVVIPSDGAGEVEAIDSFLRSTYETPDQGITERAASDGPDDHVRLSFRQREVLDLVARGRTNREIAEELVLSLRTIERHIADIYAKIGVRNRTEAVAYALTKSRPL